MSDTKLSQDPNSWFSGYRIELEDRDELQRTSTAAQLYKVGDIPENFDIREHPKHAEGWLKMENQYSQGSCQGQSLTECMEYCYTGKSGQIIQLSRQMAYIQSQKPNNIRSDSGSTLSGGTKAAKQGICLESTGPYQNRYPGWNWVTSEMIEEGKKYRMNSHTPLRSPDEVRQYIGSGVGIVQIGIAWNGSCTPDRQGFITNWRSGGGGHAVVFCGYCSAQKAGRRNTAGWWLIVKNSWGTRWGKGGFAYWDPSAVAKMLGHRWSVFYGRSDMTAPEPRPEILDWSKIW